MEIEDMKENLNIVNMKGKEYHIMRMEIKDMKEI